MQRRPVSLLATAVLALAVGVSGCSADSEGGVSVTPGPAAAEAPAAGATLDAADFAAALKAPGTVILDVRTPAEFAEGHLPGAVNLDVQSPEFAAGLPGLDPTAAYAVYCRSGNRSQVAVDQMAQAGITTTYHLAGGIGAWQQAGGEVVTG